MKISDISDRCVSSSSELVIFLIFSQTKYALWLSLTFALDGNLLRCCTSLGCKCVWCLKMQFQHHLKISKYSCQDVIGFFFEKWWSLKANAVNMVGDKELSFGLFFIIAFLTVHFSLYRRSRTHEAVIHETTKETSEVLQLYIYFRLTFPRFICTHPFMWSLVSILEIFHYKFGDRMSHIVTWRQRQAIASMFVFLIFGQIIWHLFS